MTQGKIRRDLLIAFASQLGFKILGFAVLAVMARLLSPAEYGKLMFALTLCGVCSRRPPIMCETAPA